MSETAVTTEETTEMAAADILRAAREKIAEQRHFVMGVFAWDRDGRRVDPTSPDAWRWNARGAICAVSGIRPTKFGASSDRRPSERPYALLDAAAESVASANGITFPAGTDPSDNLGHALTLRALGAAIAMAEGDTEP